MTKRKARVVGAAAGAGTGAALMGATASLSGPVANLGGYAVAQTIAGSVGFGGPALSVAIAAVGGPVVVGVAASAVIGCGAYAVAKWLWD